MAISSIGTASRDYVDLNAWVADLPGTTTEQEVAELHNDSEFTSASTQSITGITTTASFNLVIRPATGEAFTDTEQDLRYNASNGVSIRKTTNYAPTFTIAVPFTSVSDIQFNADSGSNAQAFSITTAGTDVVINNCLFSCRNASRVIEMGGADSIFINCCVIVLSSGATGSGGTRLLYRTGNFFNCTFFTNVASSTALGLEKVGGAADSSVVKNCAVFDFGTALESGSWGSGTDFNATDDSSLPAGSNNQTSLTTADQFEDITTDANLDLRAVSGGSLKNGTPDSGNTNDLDIFGNARDLTTPFIGCYEVVAASTGRIMSSLAGAGGLAYHGGLAGKGGGLAG